MKKIVFAIPFIALTLAGWAQHKPERDPFVQMGSHSQIIIDKPVVQNPVAVITPQSHPQPQVHERLAPKLKVIGLVTNSPHPKAIVAGEKSTYIVSQGDKLGDYRVAKIDRTGITLAFKQNRFHCPIGQ